MPYAVFAVYLLTLVGITIYTAKRSRNSSDFILGGKQISGVSLALSERATGESAWLLLGLTGEAYLLGLQTFWIALGCVVGIIFIWFVMGERLQMERERTGALTISSLLSKKFPGSEKVIGTLSASIIVFFFLFYVEAQFYGGGKVLYDTFGLNPLWGVVAGSLIVVLYCMIGGFITVVFTDVFQAILMIITLILLPVILMYIAASKDIHLAQAIMKAGTEFSSLTAGKEGMAGFLLALSGMSWALGYTGQPQLLTRMMAIRDKKEVTAAKWVAAGWTVLAYGGALMIGLLGYAFAQNGVLPAQSLAKLSDTKANGCELILPVLINFFVTPVVGGVLLCGAISAMMSTASSEIIVSSSSVTEDIYGAFSKKQMTPKQSLRFNRWVTLAFGLAAFIMALTVKDSVYGLVSYAWSGIGSSFGPALLLLLYWKKFSRAGVIASLISGTAGTIIWKTWLVGPSGGISERLASFVFAFLMAVLFSYLFPEKSEAPAEARPYFI
ncbi:MAG: sodium/proline symporter [Elusimicrobia bacterium]|nr:sodium/proline symporter [Elusimicrobiota bacterium]